MERQREFHHLQFPKFLNILLDTLLSHFSPIQTIIQKITNVNVNFYRTHYI